MSKDFITSFVDMAEYLVWGKRNGLSFERRLIVFGFLGVSAILLVATLHNFFLNLYSVAVLTGVFAFMSFFCFVTSRKGFFPKWNIHLVSVSAVIFYNLAWFLNSGASGPNMVIVIAIYIFFILSWKERNLPFLLLLLSANILFLFIIEYKFPELITYNHNREDNMINVYIGTGLTMVLIFMLILFVKQNYLKNRKGYNQYEKLKASFLSNLSHEVRTPLNVIVGFSSMISEVDLPKEERVEIDQILNATSKRLIYMFEDMMDLSKLNSDEINIVTDKIEVASLFDQLRQNTEEFLSPEKKDLIKLRCKLNIHDPVIIGDKPRVLQVLRLLITNAYRFTDHGEIEYGCYEDCARWIFYVRDTGRGIRKDYEGSIFDLFVKCQSREDTMDEGIGIGLPLARLLVEKMGGQMCYKTEYSKGSKFYFSIPKPKGDKVKIQRDFPPSQKSIFYFCGDKIKSFTKTSIYSGKSI